MSDLVERARAIGEGDMYDAPATTHKTINELADALEAQAEQIDTLNAEVERYLASYKIAHDQAMENGQAAAERDAQIETLMVKLAKAVEDAYREGHGDGRVSEEHIYEDTDWLGSRSRAALEVSDTQGATDG